MGIFDKKWSEFMGNMEANATKKKIDEALRMLEEGDTEKLAKKIGKVDIQQVMEKLDKIDKSTIDSLGLDMDALRKKISDENLLDTLSEAIGKDGSEMVGKIKSLIED